MRLTNREPNLFEKREQINPIKKNLIIFVGQLCYWQH